MIWPSPGVEPGGPRFLVLGSGRWELAEWPKQRDALFNGSLLGVENASRLNASVLAVAGVEGGSARLDASIGILFKKVWLRKGGGLEPGSASEKASAPVSVPGEMSIGCIEVH